MASCCVVSDSCAEICAPPQSSTVKSTHIIFCVCCIYGSPVSSMSQRCGNLKATMQPRGENVCGLIQWQGCYDEKTGGTVRINRQTWSFWVDAALGSLHGKLKR